MARLHLILSVLCVCVSCCVCKVVMHGQLQSPQYPEPYPSNVHQQWDLEVPHGYQLQISFQFLDIEPSFNCCNDSLMILHDNQVLGKFCGQNSTDPHHPGNNPILSPRNRLQLVFVTDKSNTDAHFGFSAFYTAVDIDECSSPDLDDSELRCTQICLNTLGSYLCTCHHGYLLQQDQRTCVLGCNGGIFTESEGVLSSPGYPNAAPLRVNCLYNVSVEPGFQIILNFNDNFNIMKVDADEPTCLFNWLQVSVPGEAPKKLCGYKSPGVIHTGSHTVGLEFHTDENEKSKGFRLCYTTQRVECKIEGGIPNGRVTQGSHDTRYKLDTVPNTGETSKNLCGDNGPIIRHISSQTVDKKFQAERREHSGEFHSITQIIDCGEPKMLLNGGFTYVAGSKNEYTSVIQYHCNEPFYSFKETNNINFTCDADQKWRGNDNDIIPCCFPVCGRPVVDIAGGHGRIFGGQLAKNNSFPWQVFLQTSGRGGAIVIGEKWLLTAAHTFNNDDMSKDEIKVFVGSNKVSNYFKGNTQFKPLPVESFHIHPGFKSPDFNNDIALIKLSSSITFNAGVMPVCLPEQDSELQNSGWVSGFGLTETYHTANHLRYIALPIVDQEVCRLSFEEVKKTFSDVSSLTENMFCAGLPEGGKDTCQGDAGSGFVTKKNDVFYAAGIVSWGVDCAKAGRFGVYTRVARYSKWIQNIMEETQ